MGWMAPLRHQCAKLVFSENHQEREPSMSEITTVGLDLAKHVFQVHGIDAEGTTILRRRLRRYQVLAFFSRLPRCVVGMEACATAHYWARELAALGHHRGGDYRAGEAAAGLAQEQRGQSAAGQHSGHWADHRHGYSKKLHQIGAYIGSSSTTRIVSWPGPSTASAATALYPP